MLMIIAVAAFAFLCGTLVVVGVRRSRRRRWRAERKERHRRIARDWAVMRTTFAPRRKRLTYDSAEGDGIAD